MAQTAQGSASAGPIYMDHNATAPCDPRVVEAMLPWLGAGLGNSRSLHAPGRRSALAIEAARMEAAALIGGRPEGLVFTSGGSEAVNLAIKGLGWARGPQGGHRLLHSALEHSCVRRAMAFMQRFGFAVESLPVDGQGRLGLAHLESSLAEGKALLVACQAANNEIGTIQALSEVASLAHQAGALLLVDAAQGAGKLPIKALEWGLDMVAVAGHKLHAPQGIGFLHLAEGLELEPLIHGAGHEGDRRSGTHPVALIVALGEACRLARLDMEAQGLRLAALRDRLEALLKQGWPELVVNGAVGERVAHLTSISFLGLDANLLLANCPELAATTGAACHSGSTHPSDAMVAIQAPWERARGTVRLSLGRHTTQEHVALAAKALLAAARRLAAVS